MLEAMGNSRWWGVAKRAQHVDFRTFYEKGIHLPYGSGEKVVILGGKRLWGEALESNK
jgi:hypothetical protein